VNTTVKNTITPDRPDAIVIPAAVRDWPLAQMPLSVRLAGVLQKMGLRTLGDLNTVLYD
jgi:hypothetical protein